MSPCRAPPRGLAPPRSVLRPRPPRMAPLLLLLLLPPLFLSLLLLLPLPEEKGGGARLAGSSRGLVRARGMSRMAAATTLAGGRCTLSEPRSAACTMWPSALNRRFSASSSACVRVWVGLTAPSYRTHQHR